VRAALDLALGEQCEPALDLVEPRGMRGGEVQMVSRPFLEPLADQRCLVGTVVIQHQMDIELEGNDRRPSLAPRLALPRRT